VYRLAIEEDAVLLLPVVAQAFAVVGRERDDRAVVERGGAQLVQQPAHQLVRIRDLSVVGQAVA
jgi:hypothetical protein